MSTSLHPPRISVGNRSTDSTSSAHHAPAEISPNRQANTSTPFEPLIAKMPAPGIGHSIGLQGPISIR